MRVNSQQSTVYSLIAVVFASSIGGGAAFGAAKYNKKESEIQATQTALTKPTQRKADDKHAPTITADDIFQGVGSQVKSITDAQIKTLQRLIDVTNDQDPEKPDLMFRMAELYAEQEHFYNFKARDIDQKVYEAQQKGDERGVGQMKAQQADYEKKEKAWLTSAVKQYLAVANNPAYEKYKRMDQVLFYLAYLLTQQKREDLARPFFKRLIKDFPKSQYMPYAFLSFGEYYFEQKQLEDALKFYDKVLQFTDSPVYGFAKYKEGWVYFNLGDFKQALATFVAVIDLAEHGKNKEKLALGKEAKKDSVRAYARVGTPDKAWPFFQRIGGTYAMTMLEMLGELYNSQGQFADAIKIYRQLMTIAPNDAKVCTWQNETLKNVLSMTGAKASPEAVKELQRLAAVYDKVKDDKKLKPEQMDECKDNTANTLRELATVWHKEAQKTNDNNTYDLAQYLYREYLTKFPKEKDAYIMTWYFSELLFKLGTNGNNQKFCDAAPEYTKVVEMDPSPKAKYLREAAYAAVISWKNCLSVEESKDDVSAAHAEKAKAGKGKSAEEKEKIFAPQPIPDRQLKMLSAFDTYIKYVPDAPELPRIKYNKARVYYEANHFAEAEPLFKDIAENHQDSDLAIYSANLYLDCLSVQKKFRDLEATVEVYLNAPKLIEKDPAFKQQLGVLKVGSMRLHIQDLEKTNKNKAAADLYIELASEYPNDPKLDEVYYNAAVLYEKGKLIGLAIQARLKLIELKPDSTLAKKAIYLIGRNFQDIGVYESAADNYEKFASKYPGEKDASTALFTASFFRRGLGQNDKSIEDTQLFTKLYGGRHEFVDKAAGVAFGEGQIFEQQKDYNRLQKHLTDYLKTWGPKGGVDRQVLAHVKLGEILWKESCPVPGVNGACIELTRARAAGAARVKAQAAKAAKGKKHKKKGADLPPQCGPETKSKIVVHDRKPALVKEAMGHFTAALTLFKGGAASKSVPGKDEQERNDRGSQMTYFAAEARMMEGDAEYEKFLNIKIPDKLDFSDPPPDAGAGRIKAQKAKQAESKKKFEAYITGKGKALDGARNIYQNVILFKQAHWAIAAAARIGQLYQDFSGQLYTAPVPKIAAPPGMAADEWDQYFHDAYCDQLVDQADKIEAKAIEGLGICLNKSTELSWFNEWSALCEAELNQIKPAEYPLASEIRAEPGYVAVVSDRASVQPLESK
jgi:tetratricopeptide (TPR) repeat protein